MINSSEDIRSSSVDFDFMTEPSHPLDDKEGKPQLKYTESEIVRSSEKTADFNGSTNF